MMRLERTRSWVGILLAVFILLGIGLRFYHITRPDFIFYDEGYYFNLDKRHFMEMALKNPPQGLREWGQALYADWRIALGSGKPIWVFLNYVQFLWGNGENWYFTRLVSAVFGCLTMGLVYLFSRRLSGNFFVAALSTMLFAVLPSHVFYSRTGLQEGLSTFLFLAAFYFYGSTRFACSPWIEASNHPERVTNEMRSESKGQPLKNNRTPLFFEEIGWRAFLSGFLAAMAYFSNYRLIILPVMLGFCAVYTWLIREEKDRKFFPAIRKYVWWLLTFFFFVIMIASFDKAQHMKVIVPWMAHQADLAQREPFAWQNLFSYPYYLFRLESMFLGILFWASFYLVTRKQWGQLFPFFLVCLQMLIFSFAQEKAARYICVVTPFIALAAAISAGWFYEYFKRNTVKSVLIGFLALMLLLMSVKSWAISQFESAYRPAMEYIKEADPETRVVTSQKWIMNLFTKNYRNVHELPHTFVYLLNYYARGYRYLVIDPQAYISWTQDKKRFSPPLEDYLRYLVRAARPVKTFAHLSPVMLERFVFEHSENLPRSIRFLDQAPPDTGGIRVYDLSEFMQELKPLIENQTEKNKS